MQIIIEIPEAEIPKHQDIIEIPLHFVNGKVCEAGGYGFDVLPKGHGTLKDVDNIKTAFPSGEYVRTESVRATIDHEETIIEANTEEREGTE